MSVYHVPGTILSLSHIVFNPFSNLWSRNYFYPHFQMMKAKAQYALLEAEPQCSDPRWSGSGIQICNCNTLLPLHSNTEQWCVSVYVLSIFSVCIHTYTYTYSNCICLYMSLYCIWMNMIRGGVYIMTVEMWAIHCLTTPDAG